MVEEEKEEVEKTPIPPLPGSLSSTWRSGGVPRGHHIDLALTDTCWRGIEGGLVVVMMMGRRWCLYAQDHTKAPPLTLQTGNICHHGQTNQTQPRPSLSRPRPHFQQTPAAAAAQIWGTEKQQWSSRLIKHLAHLITQMHVVTDAPTARCASDVCICLEKKKKIL